MESQRFDVVKFEKDRAMARFNRFRRIARLRQVVEVAVVLGLISWSSARVVPEVLRSSARYSLRFFGYLFNHHVVFLIGNAIIVLLFVLCRYSDAESLSGSGGDFYDEYAKHSEAAQQYVSSPPPPPPPHHEVTADPLVDDGDEISNLQVAVLQYDDVSAAIQKATRQIKRFQRAQSEKLKQEIAARPRPATALQRSETQTFWKTDRFDAAEIERLSSEEFRRTVDAFIDKHWSGKSIYKTTSL